MPASFHSFLRKVSWDDVPYPPIAGFAPYAVFDENGAEEGLFTGYFEPELRGALQRCSVYQYPVLAPPKDLIMRPNFPGSNQPGINAWGINTGGINTGGRAEGDKLIPHFTRAEIDGGALDGLGLELFFVDDRAALFFAHVQGSASIVLPDGSRKRIGFAGKNGHPYTAIGKVLKNNGALLPPVTMQRILAWLRENPGKQDSLFASNASYIFFKVLETSAPLGASGQPLTTEVSLAVDDTIWPYGIAAIIATQDPLVPGKPLILKARFDDTGSAIRGVIRGDIYFGAGETAALKAGAMNRRGKMWVLLEEG